MRRLFNIGVSLMCFGIGIIFGATLTGRLYTTMDKETYNETEN